MEIVGRVTANATVHQVKNSDSKVVNFSIAINDRFKKKDGELKEIATYFNCSYWINAGIVEHLTKGTLVELNGRVSVNAWVNTAGEAKGSLNFHVNSIKLHGKSKSESNAAIAVAEPLLVQESKDDLPF